MFDDEVPKKTAYQFDQPKTNKVSLFDLIDDISTSKKRILKTPLNSTELDHLLKDDHFPFQAIANAMLKYPNTIAVLDLINQRNNMPLFVYEVLLTYIPSMKRRGKWSKVEDDKTVQIIAAYFDWSLRDAEAYKKMVNDQELEQMKVELKSRGIDV